MRLVALFSVLSLLATAALAGGHDASADAAVAATHANDQPIASAVAETAPATAVTAQAVTYGEIDGQLLTGYLARPAGSSGPLPALIVIHEWWGLNDNIRRTTERLAGEGFVALAVDLYDDGVAAQPKQAMQLMQALSNDTARAEQNLREAHAYLTDELGAPRTGSIGWCLGGRWSLRTALLLPDELDATVIYYGTVSTDPDELASLQMPILANFASDDPIIPQEMVDAFTETLNSLGKDADVKVYPDTKHAFSNPSGMAYQPEAAADAWQRSTAFLRAHLMPE